MSNSEAMTSAEANQRGSSPCKKRKAHNTGTTNATRAAMVAMAMPCERVVMFMVTNEQTYS